MDVTLFLVFRLLGVHPFGNFIFGFETSEIQNCHQTRPQRCLSSLRTYYFINKSEIVSSDLKRSGILHERYMICDNALVYFWNNEKSNWGAYAGLTSPPTNVVTRWNGCVNSLSPTSGRIVYIDENRSGTIVVVDLF